MWYSHHSNVKRQNTMLGADFGRVDTVIKDSKINDELIADIVYAWWVIYGECSLTFHISIYITLARVIFDV